MRLGAVRLDFLTPTRTGWGKRQIGPSVGGVEFPRRAADPSVHERNPGPFTAQHQLSIA